MIAHLQERGQEALEEEIAREIIPWMVLSGRQRADESEAGILSSIERAWEQR